MDKLAKKFSTKSLLLFAMPSMLMMVFLSLYTIVDGMFVSANVGTDALAAINIAYPILSLQLGISIMFASGASAVIGKKLGEGKIEEAKQNFTFIIVVEVIVGLLFTIFGLLFLDTLVSWLGAKENIADYAKDYLRILLCFSPFFFLQTAFETLFVTAGKPILGLIVTIAAGVMNIFLDYLFIVVFQFGIMGAALGTALSYIIPAMTGILYFFLSKNQTLHFSRFRFDKAMLSSSCKNGSSEMVTNVANAMTTFLFNFVCMRYYGPTGIAAITIILYFQFLLSAIFFGYAQGVAPIISFKYGAEDKKQLKQIYRSSLRFLVITAASAFLLSLISIQPVTALFTKQGTEVYKLVITSFPLFAPSFLFLGFSIFASAFFTALHNGKISALLSFTRTLLFLTASIVFLPLIMGGMGIWIAVPLAELLGMVVSFFFLRYKKNSYGY